MLRKTEFCKSLADFIESYAELEYILNLDKSYRYFSSVKSDLDSMVEPLRDTVNRTPSEVIPMDERRFEIHHYKTSCSSQQQQNSLLLTNVSVKLKAG